MNMNEWWWNEWWWINDEWINDDEWMNWMK